MEMYNVNVLKYPVKLKQVKQWFYKLPVAGVGIEAVKLRNRIGEKRGKFSNNENSRKICEKTCKIFKIWQKVQIYLDEVKSVCKSGNEG